MLQLSPKDKAAYKAYVDSARMVESNLQFFLENIGPYVNLDYSYASLHQLETVYRADVFSNRHAEPLDSETYLSLMGQYLGASLCHHTSAHWVQCTDKNPKFAQPCLDGFCNEKWDRVFPISLAKHYHALPDQHPRFKRFIEQRILFAETFQKAVDIFQKQKQALT